MPDNKVVILGALVVGVLAVAAFAALQGGGGETAPGGGGECSLYFIMYGQEWCPHCQAMDAFVKETYGEACLEFRDLDVPEWKAQFEAVIRDLNIVYGIPAQPAFPLTGVLVEKDGELVLAAVIQGEVTDQQIIEQLISYAEPPEKIVVVVGQPMLVNIGDDPILREAYTPQSTG